MVLHKWFCLTCLAATSSTISSTYSDILSSSSPRFVRPNGTIGNYYYYQAIQVTLSAAGTYSFTSSSSMDTYRYLYYDSFDPSYPSRSLITSDDDSAGWAPIRPIFPLKPFFCEKSFICPFFDLFSYFSYIF